MAEVASAFVTLVPSAKGFGKGIGNEIDGDMRQAGKKGGATYGAAAGGAVGGGLKKAGIAGIIGAAVAVPVVQFVSSAIGAASDLSETINKSNAIFGANAAVVESWAADAAKNVGLSKAAALDAAAGFGNMFSQIGFTGDESAKLSTKVVELSADLGSFNNLPTADVADRISAAFRGEFDSLQALIPNINAARVEQEALAMTGKTVASELTAQEKAAATLAIVQKDGALAAGDFAKTSDGLANSQKILRAEFDNVKAQVGTALLPVMTSFMNFLVDKGVPALKGLIENVKENKDEIKRFALTVAEVGLLIGQGFLQTTALLLDNLARQVGGLRMFVSAMLTFADRVLGAANAAFGWVPGVGEKLDSAQSKVRALRVTADQNLSAVESGFRSAADGARAASDAAGRLRDKIADIKSRQVTVTVNYNQNLGGLSPAQADRLAGRRALGGPVRAGHAYLVGERRPEVFVPNQDGKILPRVDDLTGGSGSSTGGPGVGDLLEALNRVEQRLQRLPDGYRLAERQEAGRGGR